MKKEYAKLFETVTLNNGVKLNNRFAMAPMGVFGSNADGTPNQLDLDFMEVRNEVGSLLITGSLTFMPDTKAIDQQMTLESDDNIPKFVELAKVMKAAGNKAIVQLQHPGREGALQYQRTGKVYGPSAIDFAFLDYPITELSDEEIKDIIKGFGDVTRRLIAAGFDGVEIHGANHFLLQQFFSRTSNIRSDHWGGSFAKRMNFPLEVIKEVQRVRKEENAPEFIIGYRISAEEVHGDTIGYTIDDTLKFVDIIADMNLDYIHTSTFGGADFVEGAYKLKARSGNVTKPMNQLLHELIDGRTTFIVVGNVNSAESALDAANYGEMMSMGVGALADPQMANKIKDGKEETINMNVKGRLDELKIPQLLIDVYRSGAPLPPMQGVND